MNYEDEWLEGGWNSGALQVAPYWAAILSGQAGGSRVGTSHADSLAVTSSRVLCFVLFFLLSVSIEFSVPPYQRDKGNFPVG